MLKAVWAISICAALSACSTNKPTLDSGPMLSLPQGSSFQVWMQADSADIPVTIHYWANIPSSVKYTWSGATEADGIVVANIENLKASTLYQYQIELGGNVLPEVYSASTLVQHYFPQTHDISFLFGSCSWWKEDRYPLIETMANHPADFTLWLGDNLYLDPWDHDHPGGIASKYRKVRKHTDLKKLLASKGNVATWDDHDYGRDDATGDWPLKTEAREVFSRYWLNPSYGTEDVPGVHTQFRISDVDFIVMDDRSYRDDPENTPPVRMFGNDQIRWLKNMLLTSRARLKILVSGSQWLNPLNAYEGWNRHPEEREEFLAWLAESDIPGVIFLSGDRHFTEAIKLERESTYPLYEFTCSPMTSIVLGGPEGEEKNSPYRLEGTLVVAHNYCEMKITGDKDNRVFSVKSFDENGKENWHKQFGFSEVGL